uniref:Uncharacterized protein n=1 Tax=Cacopsylla melanoneura TaxID=428564 RepID=A0A8D8TR35_9HEMI
MWKTQKIKTNSLKRSWFNCLGTKRTKHKNEDWKMEDQAGKYKCNLGSLVRVSPASKNTITKQQKRTTNSSNCVLIYREGKNENWGKHKKYNRNRKKKERIENG